MNVSRESVSLALLSLFTPLVLPNGPFTTVTRILEPFTSVDKSKLPYLCVAEDDEGDNQKEPYGTPEAFGLEKYSLDYVLWIYTPISADVTVTPATALNNALDAVDLAIQGPIKGELQTLGGIATNCWINGKVMKQVGIVGQGLPSVARIPVTILTGA